MPEPSPWPSFDVPPGATEGQVLHTQDGWEWVYHTGGAVTVREQAGGVAEVERTWRERADGALTSLQSAWTNWDSLTAVQKDAALKLTVRVVIGLARLVLKRFDAT